MRLLAAGSGRHWPGGVCRRTCQGLHPGSRRVSEWQRCASSHAPHAQLAIVLQGQCDYYVDGKPYRMKEGSWVFVPADVEHYIHVYDSDVPVMNLDVFFPERMEYVDAYDEFVAGLEESRLTPAIGQAAGSGI